MKIQNPPADTSALAWLLVFEDLENSSPVNGVSNVSITTFLLTLPSISAVKFLISLYLVINSPPFGQDKVCCKLNESQQTHSVGKRSRGILCLIRIAYPESLFLQKKKLFLFTGITVNQIDAPFSVDASIDLNFDLHDVLFLTSRSLQRSAFSFVFDVIFYSYG